MTVPTHAEFAEAIGKLVLHSPIELPFLMEVSELRIDSTTEVSTKLRRIVRDRAHDFSETVAMKWLERQPSFALVRPQLFPDQQWQYHLGKLDADSLPELEAIRKVGAWLRRVAIRLGDTLPYSNFSEWKKYLPVAERLFSEVNLINEWIRALLMALDEYYYGDSTENITTKKRDLRVNLKSAINGLNALRNIEQDPFAARILGSISGHEFFAGQLDRRVRDLTFLANLDEQTVYPVHKEDRTTRERLYVYRIAVQHQKSFGSPKAEAVVSLLEIEGIAEKIDARNVKKLCAGFKRAGWQLF
jgi:hypothetical protein